MKHLPGRSLASIGILLVALGSIGCPKPAETPTPAPSAEPTEMGVTVRLVVPTGTDPEKVELKASAGTDHIRWKNETTQDRTIHFKVDWPFMESSGDFIVAAGATSPWYTLDAGKVAGGGRSFPYEVIPTLTGSGEAPDDPDISGQP